MASSMFEEVYDGVILGFKDSKSGVMPGDHGVYSGFEGIVTPTTAWSKP